MRESVDKIQKNQNSAAANMPSPFAASNAAILEIVDNRANTAQLRMLQAAADNSSQAASVGSLIAVPKTAPVQRIPKIFNDQSQGDLDRKITGQMKTVTKNRPTPNDKNKLSIRTPVQKKVNNLPQVSSVDKKIIANRKTKKLNKQIRKYNKYSKFSDYSTILIPNDDYRERYKSLIEISSTASDLGLYSSPIKTITILIGALKREIKAVHKKLKLFGVMPGSNSEAAEEEGNNHDIITDQSIEAPLTLEDEADHPLASTIEHFAPSMEATIAAPADMVSASISAATDESMGNVASLGSTNDGLSIGLSALGQITSLSSLILATKKLHEAEDSDEKTDARLEIANSAIAFFKTTASMADTIVNMQASAAIDAATATAAQSAFNTIVANPGNIDVFVEQISSVASAQTAVSSAASASTTAAGSVAAAAGIVWNAFQLVINSYEAAKAGKAFNELSNLGLNEGTFKQATSYAKERVKRKRIRRAVNAASSGIGIVSGAVGIAILAGVAATPAGWALMAAGLMIGVGILGYKIGKYLYKKHHRNNKASDLIIDIDSPDTDVRDNATTYLIQVLGLDVGQCREQKANGQIGKLKQVIVERMENKRNIIAVQLVNILKNPENNPDFDGAVEIMKALDLDVGTIEADDPNKIKKKIVKALASW